MRHRGERAPLSKPGDPWFGSYESFTVPAKYRHVVDLPNRRALLRFWSKLARGLSPIRPAFGEYRTDDGRITKVGRSGRVIPRRGR